MVRKVLNSSHISIKFLANKKNLYIFFIDFQRVTKVLRKLIGRITDNAYNRHRIFSVFRGRGQAPTGRSH